MLSTMLSNVDITMAALVYRIVLHRNLGKAQAQILHLKRKLKGLIWRYRQARIQGIGTAAARSLAIQIDVTEGMRSMVYEYARDVADKLSDLYWDLHKIIVLFPVDFDDQDNDRPDEEDDDDIDAASEVLAYDCRV